MNVLKGSVNEIDTDRPLLGLALGNSHLAAVRLAYTQTANRPEGIGLDFLASGQAGLADIAIDQGDLVATSPTTAADFLRFGTRARIPLADYDFFLVVGLGFNVYGLEPIYREHRCIGLKNWQSFDSKRSLVSEAAMRKMIATGLYNCLSARVANLIRQNSDKPIFQQAQPRPAESLLQQKRYPSLRRAVVRGDAQALSALFETAAPLACLHHYLPQPPETLSEGLLTATAFTGNAPRLTADPASLQRQPDEDFLHANAAYGARVLHHLGQALASPRKPSQGHSIKQPLNQSEASRRHSIRK